MSSFRGSLQEELDIARVKHKTQEGYKILPLLIDESEVPTGIRHLKYADFREWQIPERYYKSLRELFDALDYHAKMHTSEEMRHLLTIDSNLYDALRTSLIGYRLTDIAIDAGWEFESTNPLRMCWNRLQDEQFTISMEKLHDSLKNVEFHESDRVQKLKELCSQVVTMYSCKAPPYSPLNLQRDENYKSYLEFRDINYRIYRILFSLTSEMRALISAGLRFK